MKTTQDQCHIAPDEVHGLLAEHMLVDGFPLVLDLAKSHGSRLVDARDSAEYLDFYTFFGSAPLGMNPPGLFDDPATRDELVEAASNKPANAEVPTVAARRVRRDFRTRARGSRHCPICSSSRAAHSRSRMPSSARSTGSRGATRRPGAHRELGSTRPSPEAGLPRTQRLHPLADQHRSGQDRPLPEVRLAADLLSRRALPAGSPPGRGRSCRGAGALSEAKAAFEAHPHDIACFISEPIQCEGGDRHLRSEFLLAVQELCLRYDALFVLDEVQTGAWGDRHALVLPTARALS